VARLRGHRKVIGMLSSTVDMRLTPSDDAEKFQHSSAFLAQ
jgi:hypothetical protein